MEGIRKIAGALFAVVGAYYCALGGVTLARVSEVTAHWVRQSGDPEFRYDYDTFVAISAFGAASIALLGAVTVVKGIATARGRQASWLGPAVAALPLHWIWLLYRTIGTGILARHDQIVVQRNAAIQFGAVCAGYFALWILTRRPNRSRPMTADAAAAV